jgi:hypothetical protein
MVPVFFQGLTAEQINAAMIGASQQVMDRDHLDEIMTDVAQTVREIAAMPSGFSRASSSLIVAAHPTAQKLMREKPELFTDEDM